ncbi:hypothetical protein [Cupriavidus sp. UME77]|uniref:hypothetical protein n=1 Tax=Cupriavidus sp. UME77 TaxID=1862321 RepID=UPI0016015A49|nr:hypothetical protein [Cupriavidus sp. UME77]
MKQSLSIGLTTQSKNQKIWQFFYESHRIGPATGWISNAAAEKRLWHHAEGRTGLT